MEFASDTKISFLQFLAFQPTSGGKTRQFWGIFILVCQQLGKPVNFFSTTINSYLKFSYFA